MEKSHNIGDEKLTIELLTVGDKTAFEGIYRKYKNKLYCYCFSIIPVSCVVEDIVQETFIKIWEKRESLNSDYSFASYLFTIAHNKVISYIRKSYMEKIVLSHLIKKNQNTEELVLSNIIFEEYEQLLKKITDKLPPKRRLIFKLSREEGLSHKEIAKMLGISVYTVQEHISKSLIYFKANLLNQPEIGIFI